MREVTAVGFLFPETSRRKKKAKPVVTARLMMFSGLIVLLALVLSFMVVLGLRWLPPPASAFMLEKRLAAISRGDVRSPIHYQWCAWQAVSPYLPLAVVAAEDQKFSSHAGFDFDSINKAVAKNRQGGRLRGASTITQQVAKNLFLWPGKSYVRKGLEAYFTVLLELLWPKKRILEVYVNIAEFGDNIYGVQAAAERVFGKQPSRLTEREAALLAAVLPNPKVLKAKNPSPYVLQRMRWIATQMRQLGGVGYLREL